MRINTNTWNKIRYTIYTPFYDVVASYFKNSRQKSIESLDIKQGQKVLLIGAGTGLDLEFIPTGCEITATDITPSMIDKIEVRNKKSALQLRALVMDGQKLAFKNSSFDKIILHLILAVIPDPVACLRESERVLKKGGEITVFDKFVRSQTNVSRFRKFLNIFSNFLFTDITRDFESIVNKTQLRIVSETQADFNGNFRIIKLRKG